MNKGEVSVVKNGVVRISILSTEGSGIMVETRPLDLGSNREKYIDAILLEIENADQFQKANLYLKELDRLKDADSTLYDEGRTLVNADDPIFVRLQSRYVQLKIEDLAPTVKWKLTAIQFFGQPMRGRL